MYCNCNTVVKLFYTFPRESGCTDYFAKTEPEAFEMGRDIISTLNVHCNSDLDLPDFEEPLFDAADIAYAIPPPDQQWNMDIYPVRTSIKI